MAENDHQERAPQMNISFAIAERLTFYRSALSDDISFLKSLVKSRVMDGYCRRQCNHVNQLVVHSVSNGVNDGL